MLKKCIILTIIILVNTSIYVYAQSSFSEQRLSSAVVNYLKNQTNDDIEVEIMQKIRDVSFRESGISASFSHSFNDFKGLGKVIIRFAKDGTAIRTEDIRVKINKFKNMPVASKMITAGSTVDNSNIIWKRIDVTNYNESMLFTSNDIIGKKVRNGVTKGNPFNINDVIQEAIIKRGQIVSVVAQSGAVSIKTLGTALQDGGIGDMIRVKREGHGNTIITGMINNDGNVVISSQRYTIK